MALVYSIIPIGLAYSTNYFNSDGVPSIYINPISDNTLPSTKVENALFNLINPAVEGYNNLGNTEYIKKFCRSLSLLVNAVKNGAVSRSKMFNLEMFDMVARTNFINSVFRYEGIGTQNDDGSYNQYRFYRVRSGNTYGVGNTMLSSKFGRDRLIASVDTDNPNGTFRFIPVTEWNNPEVAKIVQSFTGVSSNTDNITPTVDAITVSRNTELIKAWATVQDEIKVFIDGISGYNPVMSALLDLIGVTSTSGIRTALSKSYYYSTFLANDIYPILDVNYRNSSLEDFKFYVYNLSVKYPQYVNSILTAESGSTFYEESYTFNSNTSRFYANKYLTDCMKSTGLPFTGIQVFNSYNDTPETNTDADCFSARSGYGLSDAMCDFSLSCCNSVVLGYTFRDCVTYSANMNFYTDGYYFDQARYFLQLSFMDPRMFNDYANDEAVYLHMIETYYDARIPESRINDWYKGTNASNSSQAYRNEQVCDYTMYNPFLFYYPASATYQVSRTSIARALSGCSSLRDSLYNKAKYCSFEANVPNAYVKSVDIVCTSPNYDSYTIKNIFYNLLELGIHGSDYNQYKTMPISNYKNMVHSDISSLLYSVIQNANNFLKEKNTLCSSFNLNNYVESYIFNGNTEDQAIDAAYKLYLAIENCCVNNIPSYACYIPIMGGNNLAFPVDNYKNTSAFYGANEFKTYWQRLVYYKTPHPYAYIHKSYRNCYCYASWSYWDCLQAGGSNVDFSSTLYGYEIPKCNGVANVKPLTKVIAESTVFTDPRVIKYAGYKACIEPKPASDFPGQYGDDLFYYYCNVYPYWEYCKYPGECQLAIMAYNNNGAYDSDIRNSFFTDQFHKWNYACRACYTTDYNQVKYGHSTIAMITDIATYCAYSMMYSLLQFATTMYNDYVLGDFSKYPEVETQIEWSHTCGNRANSKVDYIKSVVDTIPFIDNFYDNYLIGYRNDYVDGIINRLLKRTAYNINKKLLFAVKYFLEREKVLETKKVDKFLARINYGSTDKMSPDFIRSMYEITSTTGVSKLVSSVFDYSSNMKRIPAIKTTYDVSSGLSLQLDDYGIVTTAANDKTTFNSAIVGYNTIASFTVTGGTPTVKVIPISGVLSDSIFGINSISGTVNSLVNNTDYTSARNAIYSRTQLPKYTDFKVFTVPKSSGEIIDFNYYRAKVIDSGSVPSVYLYSEINGTEVMDTTVILLGR